MLELQTNEINFIFTKADKVKALEKEKINKKIESISKKFNKKIFHTSIKESNGIFLLRKFLHQSLDLKIGKNFEITRFKGLGEISPNEFKNFIGKDMRLDPVIINKETSIDDVLKYYMGKNTSDRQEFIINNLKIEESLN